MVNVQGISNANLIISQYQTNQTNDLKLRQQNMKSLADALQSGDLSTAQQSFAELQKLMPASQPGQAQNGQKGNALLSDDFDALGKALQSGDINAAKDAYAKLQQDAQVAQKGHHRHRHVRNANLSQGNNLLDAINDQANDTSSYRLSLASITGLGNLVDRQV
jgi:hypothetical protein